MNSLDLIRELPPSTYLLYAYFREAGNEHGAVHGKTREDLMEATGLGSVTVYKSLKDLETRGLLDYNGKKLFYRLT